MQVRLFCPTAARIGFLLPVSNKDQNGVYTIQDGKSTRTGSSAPVMTRCQKTNKD